MRRIALERATIHDVAGQKVTAALDLGSHGLARFPALSSVPMTAHQLPFGVLLRRWRERRRMTQADPPMPRRARPGTSRVSRLARRSQAAR